MMDARVYFGCTEWSHGLAGSPSGSQGIQVMDRCTPRLITLSASCTSSGLPVDHAWNMSQTSGTVPVVRTKDSKSPTFSVETPRFGRRVSAGPSGTATACLGRAATTWVSVGRPAAARARRPRRSRSARGRRQRRRPPGARSSAGRRGRRARRPRPRRRARSRWSSRRGAGRRAPRAPPRRSARRDPRPGSPATSGSGPGCRPMSPGGICSARAGSPAIGRSVAPFRVGPAAECCRQGAFPGE